MQVSVEDLGVLRQRTLQLSIPLLDQLSARERASTRFILVRVRRMTDVLIYGDTFRSPELRHEVPLGIPDPFLYVEREGAKHIAIGAMEIPRLEELGMFELHPGEEYGSDDLIAQGLSYADWSIEGSDGVMLVFSLRFGMNAGPFSADAV